MEKEKVGVNVKIDKEKYIKLRHELIDAGVSVNAMVNCLIEQHVETSNRRGGHNLRTAGKDNPA